MKLYSYFRSSAAYRVRIALSLKGIAYETQSVHLVKDGGHNKRPEFRAINPQMRVPVLVTTAGDVLIQSLAIIEYLDETHPQPPFLPKDPLDRARVRAFAELIACDIHPLNNTSLLRYLKNNMAQQQSAIDEWYRHWVITGFEALEELITPGPFTCGSDITMADLCLVPQVYNARRLNVPLERFPKIVGVDRACLAIAAFDRARPENQPDAE
ncbi:MAG: maleylacetoacetate isomerase [Xanthobacteraceae bacterium]